MSSIILVAFGFLFALLAVVFFLLSREFFFKAVMLVSETSSRHYHFLSRVLGFSVSSPQSPFSLILLQSCGVLGESTYGFCSQRSFNLIWATCP